MQAPQKLASQPALQQQQQQQQQQQPRKSVGGAASPVKPAPRAPSSGAPAGAPAGARGGSDSDDVMTPAGLSSLSSVSSRSAAGSGDSSARAPQLEEDAGGAAWPEEEELKQQDEPRPSAARAVRRVSLPPATGATPPGAGSGGAGASSAGKRRLTQDERELFMRIEKEWREEDAWAQRPPGTLSTLVWTPILIALRCINIWLTVVTWPATWVATNVLGMEIKSVGFWDVPLERRKQTLAVAGFVMLLPCVMVCYAWSLVLLLFPLTTFPMLGYYLWIFYWDRSAENGTRRPFIRYWNMWRHFANYFPLRLIKTANLDPNRKYVFAYHPHGIISVGAFGCFATNAAGFSRKFPGIDLRLLTLEMNFWCPWIREALLYMGVCSASRKACYNILGKGPGSAIMLVVGGAAESLDTEPGTYRLTLGRKGFVRVALDTGADLVPVLAFGENDIFDTMYYPPNTWARSLQEKVRKKLGFATPIFYGRGPFNYSMGVLPHRKPIIVVVGKPIKLPKLPPHLKGAALSTTQEGTALVDKYHQVYVDGLRELWMTYKNRWAIHRAGSLAINLDDGDKEQPKDRKPRGPQQLPQPPPQQQAQQQRA